MNDEALREKVAAIVKKTDPYIVFCAQHNFPWPSDENLVDQILHLIAEDRERVEREARLDTYSTSRLYCDVCGLLKPVATETHSQTQIVGGICIKCFNDKFNKLKQDESK